MVQGIPWEKLKSMVDARGLRLEPQAAFYRIGRGRCVVHVSRRDPVTRVDLKGMDDLAHKHRAVRPISEAEAKRGHLGKVRGQLDFTRSEKEVLAAFDAALERVLRESAASDAPPIPGQRRFDVMLPEELAQAVEDVCRDLRAKVPRGLETEVTPVSAIRVLLHEAVQARRLPAPELSPEDEEGLRRALRQAREDQLHGPDEARRVIESIVGR